MTYLEVKGALDLASNVNELIKIGILSQKNGKVDVTPAGEFLLDIIDQEKKVMDFERKCYRENMSLKESQVQRLEEEAKKVNSCVGIIVAETFMLIIMAAIWAFT